MGFRDFFGKEPPAADESTISVPDAPIRSRYDSTTSVVPSVDALSTMTTCPGFGSIATIESSSRVSSAERLKVTTAIVALAGISYLVLRRATP